MKTFRASSSAVLVLAAASAFVHTTKADSNDEPTRSDEIPLVPIAPRPNAPVTLPPDAPRSWVVVLQGGAVADVALASGVDRAETKARTKRALATIEAQHAAIRGAIAATGATITYELSRLVNGFQVIAPKSVASRLAAIPGVDHVTLARTYQRANANAVPFIGGYAAWSETSTPLHGEGIRIGVIDTGIDYTHADFGGPGTPAAYQANNPAIIEPGSFPTKKVTDGYDFVGDAYDGTNSPVPDLDPLDCQGLQQMDVSGGHGTHVSGSASGLGVTKDGKTFAGSYDASTDPKQFLVGPGVAPGADLVALKVFGCTGSTTALLPALDRAADPDQDGDTSDRLDVINLSLGGSYDLSSPDEDAAYVKLLGLGTFLSIAAGNDGDAFYVIGSPGSVAGAIAVAASTDQVTNLEMSINSPAVIAGDIVCAEATFTTPLATTGPVTGDVVYAAPATGCTAFTNAAAVQGKIALLDRGKCPAPTKIANALAAGAIGALVSDTHVAPTPVALAGDGTTVNLPAVGILKADGDDIKAQLTAGQTVNVTMTSAKSVVSTLGADEIASFSSRGPRASDGLLKPEISAPGVGISSAGVGTGFGPRQLDGTSMATPMITGAAALVRQSQPGLAPADVKAALMNTAVDLRDNLGNPVPISMQGAGRVQVDRAAFTLVTLASTTVAGAVAVTLPTIISETPVTESEGVTVTNRDSVAHTYDVTIEPTYPLAGATTTVSPSTITVAPGKTADLSVTLAVDPHALPVPAPDPLTSPMGFNGEPRHYIQEVAGHVVLTEGEDDPDRLRLPYYAVVRAAGTRHAGMPTGCLSGDSPVLVPSVGTTADADPLETAFQLGASKGPSLKVASEVDLAASGVATSWGSNIVDPMTMVPVAFKDSSLYFAVAVYGEWRTTARGQLSTIAIGIDTTGDKKQDYVVFVEPRTQTGPYVDTFIAQTFTYPGLVATATPRYVNIYPRDEHDTKPFDNSVMVLPVTISDIGLTEAKGSFNYYAFTQSPDGANGDKTDWASFDATKPALNTAKGADDGRPLYVKDEPVKVFVDPTVPVAQLPKLLLLHHGNVYGARSEIVDITPGLVAPGNIAISFVPDGPRLDDAASATATITNSGPTTMPNVRMQVTLKGASSASATPSVGACTGDAHPQCSFGDLAPGATVSVEVRAVPTAPTLTVSALIREASGCQTSTADDTASVTLSAPAPAASFSVGSATAPPVASVAPVPTQSASDLHAGAGCDCAMEGGGGDGKTAAFAGLGLALAAALRRKRS